MEYCEQKVFERKPMCRSKQKVHTARKLPALYAGLTPIQMQRDWQGMTAGVERELPGLWIIYSSNRLDKKWGFITDNNNRHLWDITRDLSGEEVMGFRKGVMELVSTPAQTDDMYEIQNRRAAFDTFVYYMLHYAPSWKELLESLNEVPGNEEIHDFNYLRIPLQNRIRTAKIGNGFWMHGVSNAKHAFYKDRDRINTGDQLTIGATMDQTYKFVRPPWLRENYAKDELIEGILRAGHYEEEEKDTAKKVYAYLASLAEKEAEIRVRFQGEGMSEISPKNAWEVLPRTPKSQILAMIHNNVLRTEVEHAIHARTPVPTEKITDYPGRLELFRELYLRDCMTDMTAGQLITEDTIHTHKMLLFEYRSPGNPPNPPMDSYNAWFFPKVDYEFVKESL